MRLLFVTYHPLSSNSAWHIAELAGRLCAGGHRCCVAVPDGGGRPAPRGAAFDVVPYAALSAPARLFDGAPPDGVVAWTPRENVRRTAGALARRAGCPLVIHLEDNEDAVTAGYLGVPVERVGRLGWWGLRPIRGLALSHPRRMRRFLAQASGISMLMDRLVTFVPPGVPSCCFWPGYDEALFGRPGTRAADRVALGVPAHAALLVYTGNVHRGNAGDLADLYEAVRLLNAGGRPTHLLLTGENHAPERLTPARAGVNAWVTELGMRPREELPGLLAAADILVQPGRPGPFNDGRFPSKLPEFLASGKPVVLARTNLGRFLRDGEEARVVPTGTPRELADAVAELLADPARAAAIGRGGRVFAASRLRWAKAVAAFEELLRRVVGHPGLPK